MHQIRSRLTYANVVSTLALFLVIAGGSAFAANRLGKNSVGPKQIKKNAVTAAKIKNGAITPAKLNGASRTALTGAQGPKGDKGDTGDPGPFPSTLPAGKTIVGVYDLEGNAAATNGLATGDISYLYAAPGQTEVYVKLGSSDPNCTGTASAPTAPPGFTCIYETSASNASAANRGINLTQDFGVGLFVFSAGAGQFAMWGTWAATGK